MIKLQVCCSPQVGLVHRGHRKRGLDQPSDEKPIDPECRQTLLLSQLYDPNPNSEIGSQLFDEYISRRKSLTIWNSGSKLVFSIAKFATYLLP